MNQEDHKETTSTLQPQHEWQAARNQLHSLKYNADLP